ncbi:MAG: HD-GYP domain-containing protein [Lachnospira sp.]|nr:HD-GYP domain-containing protein [Lachnospira sp.]
MEKKTFFYFELEPGMVVAEDVYTPSGQLVLGARTILNEVNINRLANYSIMEVPIDISPAPIEPKAQDVSPLSNPTFNIVETERFKKFSNTYQSATTNLESHLNNIVEMNDAIDTDAILKDTFSSINEDYNSFELFDMIHHISYFDNSSFVHSVNVALIASLIGGWIQLSKEDLKILSLCGLLHDIGKLAIPPEILKKPSRLTDEEFEIMKSHASKGYEILKDQPIDNRIKQAALLHHEKCDGSGYPFKLSSQKIPLFVKIITIADIYDAMTARRVYRAPVCPFKVIQQFQDEGLHKYDPLIILTFLENVVQTYMNNDVFLSDGRIGRIVMINKLNLARPVVKVGNDFVDLSQTPGVEIVDIITHSNNNKTI